MNNQEVLNEQFKKAAQSGCLDELKRLLSLGADLHTHDDYALRYSAECGYLDIVQYLLEHGADIHADDDNALRTSAECGYLEIVELLFNKYNEDNKQQLATDIINYHGNEEFKKLFNAKILSNKLHVDLKKDNIIIKKIKI